MKAYIDELDAEEQIAAEEMIAAAIFDRESDRDGQLSEEDCADLGREILKSVLWRFRKDLFVK